MGIFSFLSTVYVSEIALYSLVTCCHSKLNRKLWGFKILQVHSKILLLYFLLRKHWIRLYCTEYCHYILIKQLNKWHHILNKLFIGITCFTSTADLWIFCFLGFFIRNQHTILFLLQFKNVSPKIVQVSNTNFDFF